MEQITGSLSLTYFENALTLHSGFSQYVNMKIYK